MDLLQAGAAQLATSIRRGEVGPVELTEAYLARIESLNPRIGAFITVDADGARRAAAAAQEALKTGGQAAPLLGVPIAVKDVLTTRGLKTTCGSRMLATWKPPYDAHAVACLRAAGAVIIGKTNMDEFAMGSSNENSAFGPCRNPWDLERVAGGSSGGSAAAVAARLSAGSLGSDTGGSIRQPAAFCGVVGLKPTYGRISRYGLVAFASSLDQIGPLATRVEDCALMLEVIAGKDARDATSVPQPVGAYQEACKRGVEGLRIGIPAEYFGEGLSSAVGDAVQAAIDRLRALGAEPVAVTLPHTRHAVATYYLICTAEASSNLARFDGVRYGHRATDTADLRQMYEETRHDGFGPEVKRRIVLGTFALSAGYYDAFYAKAQRVRTLIRQDFARAFEQCDALVTPTTPSAAFRLGEKVEDPLEMYLADIFTISCNLAGLPGMSLPCGFSEEGLPLGLQVLGPPLGEEVLFAIGGAYQRETQWAQRIPALVAEASRGAAQEARP